MKNIEPLKKKYTDLLSQKYKESPQKLSGDSLHMMAEIMAYREATLPEEVRRCAIWDFDGSVTDGENRHSVMSDDVALMAKDRICQYCWGKTWQDVNNHFKGNRKQIEKFFKSGSIMEKRHEAGHNLMIFGESSQPIGRTMVASIVMKEAIQIRCKSGQRGQTYEWIDYAVLKSKLTQYNDGPPSPEIADWRSCNWLVVDNIQWRSSPTIKSKEFVLDKVDPFFIGRLNDNLPTIFVFKFDIRKQSFNIEKEMGTGMSKVALSRKTLKVPLSKESKVI